jgi:sporulation protein YlmC with PRC-barrel domain
MRRVFQNSLAIALVVCLAATTASAQTNATRDVNATPDVNVTRDVNATRDADASRLDEKTSGANIRVSQLMGLNLQNSQGESVGEIKDIVLDARSGKVNYAVVTYGGFLGMGNKLFAVPFKAFKVQVDPDELEDRDDDIDEDDYVMVLDVTQQQLEGQQGFDEDNWPNMADKQWAADLNKRYNVHSNKVMDANPRKLKQNRNNNQ